MTLITGSDLYNQAWMVTYKTISGNVTDPKGRGSAWIYSDYPVIQQGKADEHPGFPLITLDDFNTDSEMVTFNEGKRSYDLNSIITIHTDTRKHLDTISSDITAAFSVNSAALAQSGLYAYSLSSGGTDTLVIDRNHKIHTKTVGVGFRVCI